MLLFNRSHRSLRSVRELIAHWMAVIFTRRRLRAARAIRQPHVAFAAAESLETRTLMSGSAVAFSVTAIDPLVSEDPLDDLPNQATFTIGYSGDLAAGHAASVDVEHLQQETSEDDYSTDLLSAIATAADADRSIDFDGRTLTFHNLTDGLSASTTYRATAATTVGHARRNWRDAANAVDSSRTTFARANASRGKDSNWLVLRDFQAAIPENATIHGIQVEFQTSSGDTPELTEIGLTIDGSTVLSGRRLSVERGWRSGTLTLGGATDSWGRHWTPADVNSPDFGVMVRVELGDARVHDAAITLHYSLPGIPLSTHLDFTVGVEDDDDIEPPEAFSVQLAHARAHGGTASISSSTATTTITDDDNRIEFSITGPESVAEDSDPVFTVSRTGTLAGGETASVDLIHHLRATESVMGTSTADYVDNLAHDLATAAATVEGVTADGTTLTFHGGSDGATEVDVTLHLADDAETEAPETFRIDLENAVTDAIGTVRIASPSAVTTILDNEVVVEFSVYGQRSAAEQVNPRFIISCAGSLEAGETASVDVTHVYGDTTEDDYTSSLQAALHFAALRTRGVTFDRNTLTFHGGADHASSLTFTPDVRDDDAIEQDEAWGVRLSNAVTTKSGLAGIADHAASASTTILDNDQLVEFRISGAAEAVEGDGAEFTIEYTGLLEPGDIARVRPDLWWGGTTRNADLEHALTAGLKKAASRSSHVQYQPHRDGEYVAFFGGPDVPASLTFTVEIYEDTFPQLTETLEIGLSNPVLNTHGVARVDSDAASATTTILDNDPRLIFSVSGPSFVQEGEDAEFTVSYSGDLPDGDTATVELAMLFQTATTTASDFSNDLGSALSDAVRSADGVSFSSRTVTLGHWDTDGYALTFTGGSANDRSLSFRIQAAEDSMIESTVSGRLQVRRPSDVFQVRLANASSSAPLNVAPELVGTSQGTAVIDSEVNTAPRLENLQFATGQLRTSAGQLVTGVRPYVTFTIADDTEGLQQYTHVGRSRYVVEVDVDGDGVPDTYDAFDNVGFHGIALDELLGRGAHTVSVRAVEYLSMESAASDTGYTTTVTTGEWMPVTGTVSPHFNRLPVAHNDAYNITNNGQTWVLDPLSNDTDPDGDSLTITSVSRNGNGLVELVDGVLHYTPDPGFTGEDVIRYYVTDGLSGISAEGEISIQIDPGPSMQVLSFDELSADAQDALLLDGAIKILGEDLGTIFFRNHGGAAVRELITNTSWGWRIVLGGTLSSDLRDHFDTVNQIVYLPDHYKRRDGYDAVTRDIKWVDVYYNTTELAAQLEVLIWDHQITQHNRQYNANRQDPTDVFVDEFLSHPGTRIAGNVAVAALAVWTGGGSLVAGAGMWSATSGTAAAVSATGLADAALAIGTSYSVLRSTYLAGVAGEEWAGIREAGEPGYAEKIIERFTGDPNSVDDFFRATDLSIAIVELGTGGLMFLRGRSVAATADQLAAGAGRVAAKPVSVVDDWIRFNRSYCFTSETLVQTSAGPRPISEIQRGDFVRSFDFETGEWTQREVLERMDSVYDGPLVTIQAAEGATVTATVYHPFWVTSGRDLPERPDCRELAPDEDQGGHLAGRWVNSHDLRAGDVIVGQTGERLVIDSVSQTHSSDALVHNLMIDGLHNYAVTPAGILVHNTSICGEGIDEIISRLQKLPSVNRIAALEKTLREAIDAGVARHSLEDLVKAAADGGISISNAVAKAVREAPIRGADWFDDVARNATRNADSDRLVLGHFAREGSSYHTVAAHYRATYFKVDDWNAVTKGLSPDEIWRINETFLTQQLRQGKQVLFSHNPLKARAGSFFEKEVNFLRELGYSFRQKHQWTWEAFTP